MISTGMPSSLPKFYACLAQAWVLLNITESWRHDTCATSNEHAHIALVIASNESRDITDNSQDDLYIALFTAQVQRSLSAGTSHRPTAIIDSYVSNTYCNPHKGSHIMSVNS